MKKIRLGVLALTTAAALLLPAFPASAEGLEVTAPSAVLMEASTGQVLFEGPPAAALRLHHQGDDPVPDL